MWQITLIRPFKGSYQVTLNNVFNMAVLAKWQQFNYTILSYYSVYVLLNSAALSARLTDYPNSQFSHFLTVLPVNIVIERVIAAQSYKWPQSQSIGEKDLCSSIQPHLTMGHTSIKLREAELCSVKRASRRLEYNHEPLPRIPWVFQSRAWYRTEFPL